MSEDNNKSDQELLRERIRQMFREGREIQLERNDSKNTLTIPTCYKIAYSIPDSEEQGGKTSDNKKSSCGGCLLGILIAIGVAFLIWIFCKQ